MIANRKSGGYAFARYQHDDSHPRIITVVDRWQKLASGKETLAPGDVEASKRDILTHFPSSPTNFFDAFIIYHFNTREHVRSEFSARFEAMEHEVGHGEADDGCAALG